MSVLSIDNVNHYFVSGTFCGTGASGYATALDLMQAQRER